MKTLISFIALILVSNFIFGQDIIIKSKELDKLVWEKMNVRLSSIGKKPIKKFEDSLTRSYASRVASNLIKEGAEFKHSDSISWWASGSECIFRKTINSSDNEFISAIESNNLDLIAQEILDNWISSPSHNQAISGDYYVASTVSTVIIYNKSTGRFRLTAVWLSLVDPKVWKPMSGYICIR